MKQIIAATALVIVHTHLGAFGRRQDVEDRYNGGWTKRQTTSQTYLHQKVTIGLNLTLRNLCVLCVSAVTSAVGIHSPQRRRGRRDYAENYRFTVNTRI